MSSESDLDTITRLIRNRRTIKPAAMDPHRPIPKDLLLLLLENAFWAPSHGMTEPWFFHIYQGSSRIQLAETLQSLYRNSTTADAFRTDKFEKLGTNPLLAPTVLAIWMRRHQAGKIPEIEEVEAVACAVQNLHLTAAAAGLGGAWSSPPILGLPDANTAFGMAESDRCLGLFYLGWPTLGSPVPKSARTPVENKVTWSLGS